MSLRVAITGGAGFLGSALAERLIDNGVALPDGRRHSVSEVVILDRPGSACRSDTRITQVEVDISDRAALADALPFDVAAVWHLAAVVSAEAEADFDLGMRVNLDGTRALLEVLRDRGSIIPVIGTSSLAVYGPDCVRPVTEASAVHPQNSYGVEKAIGELLFAEWRRRGWADCRILRLPTVAVRPGAPNRAASSFVSSIIREPLAGVRAVCPVDPAVKLWIASPATAVSALMHAAGVAGRDWPRFGAVNVPGVTVSVSEMLGMLEAHAGGSARALVEMRPDPAIAAIVSNWPADFDCSLALSLGFAQEVGLHDILAQAVANLKKM